MVIKVDREVSRFPTQNEVRVVPRINVLMNEPHNLVARNPANAQNCTRRKRATASRGRRGER
jgi:hypothetical protein